MNQEDQDISSRLSNIEGQLIAIHNRNQKVGLEKAWEVSQTRKITILILTYSLTSLVFYIIDVEKFLVSAFIPTIGYYLSTLSIPIIKQLWLNSILPK